MAQGTKKGGAKRGAHPGAKKKASGAQSKRKGGVKKAPMKKKQKPADKFKKTLAAATSARIEQEVSKRAANEGKAFKVVSAASIKKSPKAAKRQKKKGGK